MGRKRLVIVTLPSKEATEQIDLIRREVSETHHSTAALSYPPHVTLRTGVLVPATDIDRFVEEFGAIVGVWDPFTMETGRFFMDAYRDNGEIRYFAGYSIIKDTRISLLNESLSGYEKYRKSDRKLFRPHLTIAFEDLNQVEYLRLRDSLRENPKFLPSGFEWKCDNVSLLHFVRGSWIPFKVYRQDPSAR